MLEKIAWLVFLYLLILYLNLSIFPSETLTNHTFFSMNWIDNVNKELPKKTNTGKKSNFRKFEEHTTGTTFEVKKVKKGLQKKRDNQPWETWDNK